ncbi:hypothetical protein [Kordiimonas aquimaris]|uniref:hypothetical protein n=1 Tax=Kordiimonas aquimaris TaxID=707591 RepID=UPI0021D09166|nr:hypothetical protein [Kordiimonas aquimaris]
MDGNYDSSSTMMLQNGLSDYIGVCNTIMSANTERFPFAHIWQALEEELAGRLIEYRVTQDQNLACLTAIFIDQKIRIINRPQCNAGMRIPKTFDWLYIQSVIDKPARYIANPTLIDWCLDTDTNVIRLR